MPRSYRLMCDSRLDSYILRKDCESFENVFSLIEGDYMPANYVHRTKQRTVLGIAAENGSLNMMLKLLAFDESATFKDPFGKSAIDYAKENKQEECCEGCELLMCYERVTSTTTWKNYVEIGRAYRSTQGTQNIIDHNLLFHVIDHIHENTSKNGAILVFLPSYDDICEQHEKLVSVHGLQDWGYKIFALHSELNDENNEGHAHVFDRMENGVRKIILSTNIAETALTIDDVVYVASENITNLGKHGKHLVNMPIDCQLSKTLFYAIILRCLDPIVMISSALSVKDLFVLSFENTQEVTEKINETKNRFAENKYSDHQLYFNIIQNWSKQLREHQRKFCVENYISQGNMLKAEGIRRLIFDYICKSGMISQSMRELNENSSNWNVVNACIMAGFYPNHIVNNGNSIGNTHPHPSSVVSQASLNQPGLVVFEQKQKRKNGNFVLKNISVLPSEAESLLPKLEELLCQFVRY
ncbi:3'-5' RNA helicase YTHDC2-like isoform X2 [Contarinia nasturtii]|nr:3'-5' RNA helicase YTHDC2-like isoform X2 [Contarinia nasturtii]